MLEYDVIVKINKYDMLFFIIIDKFKNNKEFDLQLLEHA